MNPEFSPDDVMYRRAWLTRSQDAPSLICIACNSEIKGSCDTLISSRESRQNRKPRPICLSCMQELESQILAQIPKEPESTVPSTQPGNAAEERAEHCVYCGGPIQGIPYRLHDARADEPWGMCCWNNRCRSESKKARLRQLELIKKTAVQDARYGDTILERG